MLEKMIITKMVKIIIPIAPPSISIRLKPLKVMTEQVGGIMYFFMSHGKAPFTHKQNFIGWDLKISVEIA